MASMQPCYPFDPGDLSSGVFLDSKILCALGLIIRLGSGLEGWIMAAVQNSAHTLVADHLPSVSRQLFLRP